MHTFVRDSIKVRLARFERFELPADQFVRKYLARVGECPFKPVVFGLQFQVIDLIIQFVLLWVSFIPPLH